MDKIQKSGRFKFIVQRVIDETKAGTLKISDEPVIELNEPRLSKTRSLLNTFKRATSFIKKQNQERRVRRIATEKQLPTLFSGLKTLSLEQSKSSPPKPRGSKLHSLVTTLLKNRRKSEFVIPTVKTLGPEEIKKKYKRAFYILRVVHRLNRISEDIHFYGTSSNLFDLTTRDRTRVKKFLYPSLLNDEEEKLIEEKNIKWYIVHPKSRLRLIWTFVVLFLLAYTATIMPYRLTFEDHTPIGWRVIDYIVDLLFLSDLLMNFVSAYYDDEGTLVKDPKLLAKSYLKSWFIIDFLAVLPMDLIQQLFIDYDSAHTQVRYNFFLRLIRLPRLYRLLRILRINNIFKFIKGTPFLEWLELHSLFLRLLTFFLVTATMVHIMACIWYFEARLESENEENWISRYYYTQDTNASLYLTSLYYVISTIATVGYGDVSSGTAAEQVISIFLMILGAGFYSFTVGIAASIISSRENRLASLRRKISIANEFAHEIKASKSLKRRIRKILEYNSLRNCFSWANKKEVFSEIPIPLRHEIVMKMHGEIFAMIPFFREHSDKYFVVTIIELLKPLQISARDFLWKEGDSAESIYFLISGKVHMLSSEYLTPADRVKNQKTSIIFNRFPAGSYFGEIEIIEKTNRSFSLQATVDSEVFYLTKHDYYNVLVPEFPHIHEEFTEIAKERKARSDSCINEIRAFLDAHIPSRQNSRQFASPALSSNRLLKKNSRSLERSSPRFMSEKLPPLPRIEERKNKKAVTVEPLTQKFKLLQRKESNVTVVEQDPKSPHVPEIKFDNFVSVSLKRSSSQTPKKVSIMSPKTSDSSSTPKLVRLGSKASDPTPTPNKRQSKTDSIFAFLAQQNENNEVALVQKPSNASSKSRKTYSRGSSRLNNSAESCSSPTSESNSQLSVQSDNKNNSQPETPKFDITKTELNVSPTNSPYYRRLSGLLADRLSRTRSSVGSGVGDSTPTRLRLQTLNKMMRVGVMVSDPFIEIDEELKKRRSKEVSFLKLYVGADSEQASPLLEGRKGSPNASDEIVMAPPERAREKKKSLIKKEERETYMTKQALSKEKKKGKEDAKVMRKEIKKSEFRIKALEDKVHSMMNDLQDLML